MTGTPTETETRPKWLSTTGRGGPDEAGAAGRSAVELRRTTATGAQSLPEVLQLGLTGSDVVTLGRHEDNTAVLQLKAASKIHCQFALRTFRLPDEDKVHEALFLRDVSKNKTLVNGAPAFRPWHWVQDGDLIGLYPDCSNPDTVLDFYKVHYSNLQKLPGSLVTIEDLAKTSGSQPGSRCAPAGTPAGRKPPGRPAGRGLSSKRLSKSSRTKAKPVRTFGEEVCGRIIDLTYIDPPDTYRMLIVSFDKQQGWHICNSEGLSTWEGESFTDEVNLNLMHAQGLVKFVDSNGNPEPEPEAAPWGCATPGPRRGRKRARGRA